MKETKIHKYLSEQSEYIVKYYDSFFTEFKNQKVFVVVMELALMSLDKFINNHLTDKLTKYTLLTSLIDISKGIQTLHKNQLLHRDIAPKNILLIQNQNNDIKMKLCDFGTCINVNDSKNDISETGTLITMAPEILNQEPATYKSDIWSLGCVFYSCLFNQDLWLDKNPLQLVQSMNKYKELIISQKLLSKVNKNYDNLFLNRLLQIIKNLLTKSPKKRYTIDELLDELLKLRHITLSEDEINQFFNRQPIIIQFNKETNKFMIKELQQDEFDQLTQNLSTPRLSTTKSQKDIKSDFSVEIYTVDDNIL